MAAGITHELSQPLTAIRAFADNARLLLQRGDHDTAAMNLHHIGDAAQRREHHFPVERIRAKKRRPSATDRS
jgi:C4-dicarboxylate-specific signal transduction histidine kinase